MSLNTRASQAAAYQQFFAHLNDHMMRPMEDSEHTEIILKGLSAFGSLNETDGFRFSSWMLGFCHAIDNALYQRRVGMLDENLWAKHLGDTRQIFGMPGVAQWWRDSQRNMSPEFVALVEEILGEEARRGDQ